MKRTDLADSTRGKYEGLLRSHILPTFGKVELRRLAGAASTVRAWYYELDQRYPDGSTANDAYRCLRSSTRPWRPLQHGTRLVTPLLRGASSDGARSWACGAWTSTSNGSSYRSGSTGSCPQEPPGPC